MTRHIGRGHASPRRHCMLRVTVGESLGDIFEDLALVRGIAISHLIREAVVSCSSTVATANIARRNASPRGTLRALSIKLGPRMAATIRAQRTALNTSASAYVEACCMVYLSRFAPDEDTSR
jgi:hypothetical protein